MGSVMLVLDASGSMTAPLTTGGTRMDAAKQAMTSLVDGLPVNLNVGFEVYGTGTGNTDAEKAAGCQDVQVLTQPGRVDKDAMRAQIAGITPRGYTPISESLRQAAAALPADGPRAIVLVSDGIDTCAPPEPCDVAGELAGAGVELAVHTVGFQVDDAARAQLECIASKTGGEYHDAPDASSLDQVLPEIADRALRFYTLRGEQVEGTESLGGAPYLAPGQYVDDIAKNRKHYYRVHVPPGATGHFTAVHVVDATGDQHVESGVWLRLVDWSRRECASAKSFRKYMYEGPETASVSWAAGPSSTCDPSAAHFLEVCWDNIRVESHSQVELVVEIEPGIEGDGGTPARPVSYEAPPSRQDIAWGGGSFNEAAALPGTGRYLDKVNFREYSVYKVWLDWGQALSYQVSVTASETSSPAAVITELRGPTREADRAKWYRSGEYDGDTLRLDPVTTPPVTYANRDGGDGVRQAARAGWYYILVKLGLGDGPKPPVTEIAVSVTGDKVDGPKYAELSMPSTPPLAKPHPGWQPASSAATQPSVALPWWPIAGIAGVLVLGGALALRRVRRR